MRELYRGEWEWGGSLIYFQFVMNLVETFIKDKIVYAKFWAKKNLFFDGQTTFDMHIKERSTKDTSYSYNYWIEIIVWSTLQSHTCKSLSGAWTLWVKNIFDYPKFCAKSLIDFWFFDLLSSKICVHMLDIS